MNRFLCLGLALLVAVPGLPGTDVQAQAALSLAQARRGLEAPRPALRLAAAERLGEIGGAADAERLIARLADSDENVRSSATTSLWQIWSRSGDPAIDAIMSRGIEALRSTRLEQALAAFDEVVRRKPDFAEGWNKRATVHHLLHRHAESLRDHAEALKRNPNHFGALAGAGHNHLALGDRERALDAFRRALKLNPHLGTARDAVQQLEQPVGTRRRGTS